MDEGKAVLNDYENNSTCITLAGKTEMHEKIFCNICALDCGQRLFCTKPKLEHKRC
jgi:hypothetical protein